MTEQGERFAVEVVEAITLVALALDRATAAVNRGDVGVAVFHCMAARRILEAVAVHWADLQTDRPGGP